MTLRRLNVPPSKWRVEDISAVRNVLADVGADPALARDWRGSVVLTFAEVPESCPPYLNPSIVAFLQSLYVQSSHISCTYLNPDPANGATESFFASIGALCETEHGVWVIWSDDVATAFCRALAAAAEFAINRGDDWVAVVKGYEYHEIQTRTSEIRAILISRGVIQT
jgi:hypothetical protein